MLVVPREFSSVQTVGMGRDPFLADRLVRVICLISFRKSTSVASSETNDDATRKGKGGGKATTLTFSQRRGRALTGGACAVSRPPATSRSTSCLPFAGNTRLSPATRTCDKIAGKSHKGTAARPS